MMLTPRLRAALASVSCLMLVVPEVETTGLPLRSSIELILLDFFETKRLAVRKWVLVKEICFWRSALLVVEPHSRSMVPLASNGMRVDDVTGLSLTSSLSSLSSFFTASTILKQMSMAKPIGFWLSSRYENGIDESRWPSVIAPVSLMFFNVPVSSWALACPAQNAAASPRPIIRKYFIVLLPLLDGCGNAGIKSAGIECNFRPPYDAARWEWPRPQGRGRCISPKSQNKPAMMPSASSVTGRRMCSSGACCEQPG